MTKHSINWLEIISATDDRRQRLDCRIHSVDTGGQSCCSISINDNWLCGQGHPMLFDSTEAAHRFLSMIGVIGSESTPANLKIDCQRARQCFHLSEKGALGLCPKHAYRQTGSAANDRSYYELHVNEQ